MIEDYSTETLLSIINEHIKQATTDETTITVKYLALVGSRVEETNHSESDLDVVVIYDGNVKEDHAHEILNSETLEIDGIKLDFIPYLNRLYELRPGAPKIILYNDEEFRRNLC